MPDYRTHIIFGFLFSIIVYFLFRSFFNLNFINSFISVILIGFSSVFPDIDHRNSKIHKWVKSILISITCIIIIALCYPNFYAAVIYSAISATILYILLTYFKPRHRGITHSFRFSIFFSVIIAIFTFFMFHTLIPALFGFVAYNSHIVMDKLSQEI